MKVKLLVSAIAVGLSCATLPAFSTDTATIHQTGSNGSAGVNQTGNTGENTATIDQGPGDANQAFIDQRDIIVAIAGTPGSTVTLSQTGNDNFANVDTFRDGPYPVDARVTQNGDSLRSFVTINDSNSATTTVDQGGSVNSAFTGQLGVRNASLRITQSNTGNAAFATQISGSGLNAHISMTGNGNLAVLGQLGDAVDAFTQQTGDNNSLNITQEGRGLLDSASITQATSFNAANITQIGIGFNASIVQDTGNGNFAAINQHY